MFVNNKVCMIVSLQLLSDGCKFVEQEFVHRPSSVVLCIEPMWNRESGLSVLTSWVFGPPQSPASGWDREPHKCAPLLSRGWRRSSSY